MLKISVHHSASLITLKLEGKLAGLWVSELEKTWRTLLQGQNGNAISCDLRNLDFVDKEGRNLLRQMRLQSGATFIADSPLTRYYADEACNDFPQQPRRAN